MSAVPWYVEENNPLDDPSFFRGSERGKVHVQKGYWLPRNLYTTTEARSGAVLAGLHYFEGMCGLKVRYSLGWGLSAFSDDDLCGGCVKVIPDDLRVRLFEREQEYET